MEKIQRFKETPIKDRTKEQVIDIARCFFSRKEWIKTHQASHNLAIKMNIIDECLLHINPSLLNKSHSLEDCQKIASFYEYRSDWSKFNSSSYQKAQRKGWLKMCPTKKSKSFY